MHGKRTHDNEEEEKPQKVRATLVEAVDIPSSVAATATASDVAAQSAALFQFQSSRSDDVQIIATRPGLCSPRRAHEASGICEGSPTKRARPGILKHSSPREEVESPTGSIQFPTSDELGMGQGDQGQQQKLSPVVEVPEQTSSEECLESDSRIIEGAPQAPPSSPQLSPIPSPPPTPSPQASPSPLTTPSPQVTPSTSPKPSKIPLPKFTKKSPTKYYEGPVNAPTFSAAIEVPPLPLHLLDEPEPEQSQQPQAEMVVPVTSSRSAEVIKQISSPVSDEILKLLGSKVERPVAPLPQVPVQQFMPPTPSFNFELPQLNIPMEPCFMPSATLPPQIPPLPQCMPQFLQAHASWQQPQLHLEPHEIAAFFDDDTLMGEPVTVESTVQEVPQVQQMENLQFVQPPEFQYNDQMMEVQEMSPEVPQGYEEQPQSFCLVKVRCQYCGSLIPIPMPDQSLSPETAPRLLEDLNRISSVHIQCLNCSGMSQFNFNDVNRNPDIPRCNLHGVNIKCTYCDVFTKLCIPTGFPVQQVIVRCWRCHQVILDIGPIYIQPKICDFQCEYCTTVIEFELPPGVMIINPDACNQHQMIFIKEIPCTNCGFVFKVFFQKIVEDAELALHAIMGFQSQTPTTPFGQPQQLFGNTTNTFGSTNAFGPTSTPIFGQAQSTAPLFGSTTTTPAFGQPQTGFGTTLFGQQQQQQPSGGLFSSSTNTFGQQNKPAGFGFGSTSSTGLFGQPAQQQSSLFQTPASNNVFGSTGFGSNMNTGMTTGTVVKFVPVTGTDSMQRSGIAHAISTKHHCITVMKEYENKSFEELRWEDYQAGRKGPQQQSTFGAPQPFGATASSAPSVFGQTDQNKPAFGQSTGFGQTTGFGVAQPNTQSIFGKPASSGFGTAVTTASSFGFGSTPSTNIFGSSTAAKPFGTQSTQNLFGQPAAAQQPAFGSNNIFGQPTTQNSTIFGKPAQPTFGQTSTGFQFGQTNPSQTSTMFQAPKPTTGFGFSFGQTNTTTTPFGQTQQQPFGTFNSSFGKPFGQTQQQPSGFGTSIFGNATPKPGGIFSNTGGNTGFFNSSFTGSTPFGVPQQPQQQQQPVTSLPDQQPEEMLKLIQHFDVYGRNPALEGLAPIKPTEGHYVTNPKDIQAILEKSPSDNRISTYSQKINVLPPKMKAHDLFDDNYEESMEKSLYMRTSARRLVLRKKPDKIEQKMDDIIAKCMFGQQPEPTTATLSLTVESKKSEEDKSKQDPQSEPGCSYIASTPKEKPAHAVKQILFAKDDDERSDVSEPAFEDAIDDPEYFESSQEEEQRRGKGKKKQQKKSSTVQKSSTYGFKNDSLEQIEHSEGHSGSSPKSSKAPVGLETIFRDTKNISPEESCGVVLTRKGYFTIPPLDKLHEYKNDDGRCVISGLTIGRLGFGNVYFPHEVDVTDLNLDEIVHFQHRVLTIYPDDDNKPPLGSGLNQEAQITLDNVYPRTIKGDEITGPKGAELERFLDRLQTVSERMGGEFKEYRPETGSWVFNVPHFSKYGIDDEDTKDDPNAVPKSKDKALDKDKKAQQQQPQGAQAMELPMPIQQSTLLPGQMPSQFLVGDADMSSFTMQYMKSPLIPPRNLGALNINYSIPMQMLAGTSFGGFMIESDYELERTGLSQFNQRSTEELQADLQDPEPVDIEQLADQRLAHRRSDLYKPDTDAVFLMKNTLFREESTSTIGLVQSDSLSGSMEDDLPPAKSKSTIYLDDHGPEATKPLEFHKLINPIVGYVPLNRSLLTGRNYMDIALFKCRSMKAGWMGDCSLYSTLPYELKDNLNQVSTIAKFGLYHQNQPRVLTKELLDKHMKIVWEYSNIELVDSTPSASVKITKKALKDHWNLAKTYDNSEQAKYYQSIWDLMEAFWDKESKPLNRKERFSKWLEDIVCKEVEADLLLACRTASEVANNILALLSGHQVEKAAIIAMNNSMAQLSLLISQINATVMGKKALNKQVYQWVHSLAADKIDVNIFKIYLILAGISNTEKANVCENLDWKRALAVHLWYIAPSSKPISYIITQYEEAFKTYGYANRPSPPYNTEEMEVYDILYHLMLLHINKNRSLEPILNTSTHTNDPTDYALSWLLFATFESLQLGTISAGAVNHIHINFASQLEAMGLYNWAIFVLSFLKDQSIRKKLIMGVLYRHVDIGNENAEMESELVNQLRVSPVWIHHIKANKCLSAKRYWEAYTHLSFTQRWIECHDIAIQHLIPTLLANDQYDEMKNILYPIASGSDKIPHWKNQGGLILEFLQLHELVADTTEQDYKERYLDVNEEIISIIRRFSEFPTTTPELSLCVTEMSRKSVHLLSKFLKDVSPTYSYLTETANYHIGDLVMPPDYKVELILSVLRKQFQEKASS